MTSPGPTPVLGADGGLFAKVLPSAPVTSVVAISDGELDDSPVLNWRLKAST